MRTFLFSIMFLYSVLAVAQERGQFVIGPDTQNFEVITGTCGELSPQLGDNCVLFGKAQDSQSLVGIAIDEDAFKEIIPEDVRSLKGKTIRVPVGVGQLMKRDSFERGLLGRLVELQSVVQVVDPRIAPPSRSKDVVQILHSVCGEVSPSLGDKCIFLVRKPSKALATYVVDQDLVDDVFGKQNPVGSWLKNSSSEKEFDEEAGKSLRSFLVKKFILTDQWTVGAKVPNSNKTIEDKDPQANIDAARPAFVDYVGDTKLLAKWVHAQLDSFKKVVSNKLIEANAHVLDEGDRALWKKKYYGDFDKNSYILYSSGDILVFLQAAGPRRDIVDNDGNVKAKGYKSGVVFVRVIKLIDPTLEEDRVLSGRTERVKISYAIKRIKAEGKKQLAEIYKDIGVKFTGPYTRTSLPVFRFPHRGTDDDLMKVMSMGRGSFRLLQEDVSQADIQRILQYIVERLKD